MNANKKALFSVTLTATLLFNASQSLGKEASTNPIAAYGEATTSCGSFVESKQNETQRYIVSAPQTPDLSLDSNFRMLATSKTRGSEHEDGNGILDGACSGSQA